MQFDPLTHPWAVVEYGSEEENLLVEAIPTIWLYNGSISYDDEGEEIVKALSYYPKQVSKIQSFIDQMRSPGGITGIVDSDLWEKNHPVTVLDFCETHEIAKRHRDRAEHTDHLDTSDADKVNNKKRQTSRPQKFTASSDEDTAPAVKKLAIQSGSQKQPAKGVASKKGTKQASAATDVKRKKSQGKKSRKRILQIESDDEDEPLPITADISSNESVAESLSQKLLALKQAHSGKEKSDSVDQTAAAQSSLVKQKQVMSEAGKGGTADTSAGSSTELEETPGSVTKVLSTKNKEKAAADSPSLSLVAKKQALIHGDSAESGDLFANKNDETGKVLSTKSKEKQAADSPSLSLVAKKQALIHGNSAESGDLFANKNDKTGKDVSEDLNNDELPNSPPSLVDNCTLNDSYVDVGAGAYDFEEIDWNAMEKEVDRERNIDDNPARTVESQPKLSVRRNLNSSCSDKNGRESCSGETQIRASSSLGFSTPCSAGAASRTGALMSQQLAKKLKSLQPRPHLEGYKIGRKALISPQKTPVKMVSKKSSADARSSGNNMPATKEDVISLKQMITKQDIMLQKIWLVVGSALETEQERNVSLPTRPFRTLEEMDDWQEFLKTDVNFLIVVNVLASCATNTSSLKEIVYDMMKYLFTDKVATEFNMHGRMREKTEPKLAFSTTPTYKNMKVAIMKHINEINKGKNAEDIKVVYNAKEVQKHAGAWLKDAPARFKNFLRAEAAAEKRRIN